MSTSTIVTALSAILIASAAGLAVAGPPATTDAGKTAPVGNHPAHKRSELKGAANSAAARRQDAAAEQNATDKLGNSEIQQVMSQQAEAERLRNNAAKKAEDRVPKRTSDAIFGPSAPRGPARSASGVSRSSTIGASGIVPPDPE